MWLMVVLVAIVGLFSTLLPVGIHAALTLAAKEHYYYYSLEAYL